MSIVERARELQAGIRERIGPNRAEAFCWYCMEHGLDIAAVLGELCDRITELETKLKNSSTLLPAKKRPDFFVEPEDFE